MPIVYIHGVAVRDQGGKTLSTGGNKLLERLLESITWETVEGNLRRFVAPEIAADAAAVSITQVYWGDLAARFAWGGASCLPESAQESAAQPTLHLPVSPRSHLLADLRQPLNQIGARFFGDVMCYLNDRGDSDHPGPIPQRTLDTLASAQEIKEETGEPIIVLTNSMGGQIMYDIVTYFLPHSPQYANLRVDYWCSVASQVGLFEEMKLFMISSSLYGKELGNKVPFPDRRHLGTWWNVWDMDDIISYSVEAIIEGVDDTQFRVGQSLLKEHVGYLQTEGFYRLFADRIRLAFPNAKAATTESDEAETPGPESEGRSGS